MTNFVRGANPIWFFNNLTGAVLNDTYYAFFLTNDLPYVPQAVYQDPFGLIPWSDPIEFQPSGGLPNNLYFDDTLVYRIEIRQGPDQTYPLIWLIENYVPAEGGVEPDNVITANNMITNPDFADIYFSSPYTFTAAISGTYTVPIGPGWNLVLTGIGSTTLTLFPVSGLSNLPGNPGYYLTIANTNWSDAKLIQTFSNEGAIFSGGAIAVNFTAQALGVSQVITVQYVPSTSTSIIPDIFDGSVLTGAFQAYYGATNLPASTNTDSNGNAYVNIVFNLIPTETISITNIQITGQSVPLSPAFIPPAGTSPGSLETYQEQTYERTVDQEFHVYKNSIILQPKDSFLTGWNFPLNPWQFTTTTPTLLPNNAYTADQTIVVQQNYVSTAVGNNVLIGTAGFNYNYAFQATAATAANQIALIQYVDTSTVQPYWGSTVSSLVNLFLATTASTPVKIKMRLIYRSAALPVPVTAQNYPILSWTAGGDPVFASDWTAIKPINDPVYTIPNGVLSGTGQDFSFNGFVLPSALSGTMILGIVLYTTTNMGISAPDILTINSISLVPNEFAIECNPLTYDETLRQCEFYYEKSYDSDVLPGAAVSNGRLQIIQFMTDSFSSPNTTYTTKVQAYGLVFRTVKRAIPTASQITYYRSSGPSGFIDIDSWAGGVLINSTAVAVASFWTPTNISTKSAYYESTNPATINTTVIAATPALPYYAIGNFQYVVDTRLGV